MIPTLKGFVMSKLIYWLGSETSKRTIGTGFWIVLVIWFVLSHTPADQLPEDPIVSDKLIHFMAYLLIALLRAFSISRPYKLSFNWLTPLIVFAAFDEWSQGFFQRFPSFADFAFDLLGILIAALIFRVFIKIHASAKN